MSYPAKGTSQETSKEAAVRATTAELEMESSFTLPKDIEEMVERGAVVETVDGHRELEGRDLFGKLLDWIADWGPSQKQAR